ncbi:MAG: fibronectin type III domain-containing protein, partial [Treponema sp.]|nr:fibronectin type III domain-containing protein [Treponema sp.]
MKRVIFLILFAVCAGLFFNSCPTHTDPPSDTPETYGILTLSGFPGGEVKIYSYAQDIDTQKTLESAMAPGPIAAAAGGGSTLELYTTSNGSQRFSQSGTYLVVVTVDGKQRFKAGVSFTNGNAALGYNGMTWKDDLPSDLVDQTMIITGFPEGNSVTINVYDYSGTIESQKALEDIIAAGPIATMTGSGSMVEVKTPDGQPFTQSGTYLVVVTVNGEQSLKAGVSFTNGGAAFNYSDLQKKSDLSDGGNGGNQIPGKYAEDFWGEWIRIDNGDTWYISGSKIQISGSVNARPSNPSLVKQSAQVIKVSEGSGPPYYLFASRTANATLRGKIILMDDVSARSARGTSIGDMEIDIRNPKQPEKAAVKVQPDAGGEFAAPGLIGGDEYEAIVKRPDGSNLTVPLPPVLIPPDDPVYQPPVVPIPVVTEGVNLKTSIRPQYGEDTTRLYADGTSMNFLLEVENVGTEDCTAAIYEIKYDSAYLAIIDSSPNKRLGTLTPKQSGGSTYKKSIPLTITGKPLTGNLALKDVEIEVKINDTIVQKTWNDSVTIRYNRAKIPFRIGASSPVQGIIKVPGGTSYYFKTNSSSDGIYTYTEYLPWSTEDYFVVFSGATAATEAVYALGINTPLPPAQDFNTFNDLGIYEGSAGNDDENHAVRIESSNSIMAYLHGGSQSADIDYYRINLGNEVPTVRLVSMERSGFKEDGGNGDGKISPGESAYLDLVVKNETEQSRKITVDLSVTGDYAGQITLDKESSSIDNLGAGYYASLTNGAGSSSLDTISMFTGDLSKALKFSLGESCPTEITIPFTLSFTDSTTNEKWTETVDLTITTRDKNIHIAEPAADNCVLSPYNTNDDSHINPGDNFYYDITIKNSGDEAVSGLNGVLATTASTSIIGINTSSVNLGALEPGASYTARYSFTVSSSCPPGTDIPFTLTLTSSTGQIWEISPPAIMVKASTPANLQAAAASTDSIALSWDSVAGASGYKVYYAASESGEYTLVISPTDTTYTHTGRTSGTLYYYKVSAFGSAGDGGESGQSAAVPAKTWTNLPAFNTEVTGTVSEGIPEYYRFHVSNGMEYAFTSTRAGAVTWEDGTTWFFLSSGPQTQAPTQDGWALINLTDTGDYSFSVAIPVPGGLQAAAASTNSIALTWDPVAGASGYKVYYAASESGPYSLAGSTTGAATYTHTGRSAGTVYYYRVSTSDGSDGESERSPAVPAKTWMNLIFNKSAAGAASEDIPDYYRFHVSSGVSYTFTSNKAGAVIWESGPDWFTLNSGAQSQTADSTGWALIKFDSSGAYTIKVTSVEVAVSGFSIGSDTGTVNETAKTIAVLVPYGTNLGSLTPVVTTAAGWTCATTGPQNFTGPAEYRFTKDSAVQAYTVTVTRRG